MMAPVIQRLCPAKSGGRSTRYLFSAALLLGLLLLQRVGVAQSATDTPGSTLHHARQLTDALRRQDDATVFQLLRNTYPAAEQPVSLARIYQDYHTNPYLGGLLKSAYARLIPQLGLTAADTGKLRTHARHVEHRQDTLQILRRKIVDLVQYADTGALRGLYEKVHSRHRLPYLVLQDAERFAALRDTFLLDVLGRFASVASGRLNMTNDDAAAINRHFPNEIKSLRELDKKINNEASQIDSALRKVMPGASNLFQEKVLGTSRLNALLINPPAVLKDAPAIPQPSSASLETAALQGLSSFIAKRLKEELNASFFERFNALLQDSSYVELRTLFPNTTRLVTRGSVDYSAIVQLLRTAFDKDLRELFFSFGTLLDHPRYRRLLTAAPAADHEAQQRGQLLRYTRVVIFTLEQLQRGTHPLTVMRRVHERLRQTSGTVPAARQISGVVLTLAQAFVQENDLDLAWVKRDTIEKVLRDSAYRRAFLGLVHQGLLRQAVVLPVLADPNRLYQLVFGFGRLATDMQEQVDALRRKAAAIDSSSRLKPADFVRLYQLALEVTAFATEHTLLHAPPQVQEVERVSQAVLEGYDAAVRGRYGVTVTNLLLIANITMPNQLNNRSQLLKYAPFMAALAEARDPSQMEQAVEAVALPAGSSSVKRKTFSSLTLNAFAGLSGGAEFAYLPGMRAAGHWKPNLGFTAPVGFCYSRSIRGNVYTRNRYRHRGTALRISQNYHYFDRKGQEQYVKGQALGVFVSVIDIGALVLYRLNDPDNSAPLTQNITFRQVFSPGLWVMYHAGRSPISFFAGGQFSPELRQLSNTAQEKATANALRLNVGLTVDIPLLTFFARSEQQQHTDPSVCLYSQRYQDLDAIVKYYEKPRKRRRYGPKILQQAQRDREEAANLAAPKL